MSLLFQENEQSFDTLSMFFSCVFFFFYICNIWTSLNAMQCKENLLSELELLVSFRKWSIGLINFIYFSYKSLSKPIANRHLLRLWGSIFLNVENRPSFKTITLLVKIRFHPSNWKRGSSYFDLERIFSLLLNNNHIQNKYISRPQRMAVGDRPFN